MTINRENNVINVLVKCQKEYDKNLKNKNIMFVFEDMSKNLSKIEVFFGKRNFYHLTGIIAMDKNNKELSPNNFYDLLSRGRINEFKIKKRDNTTDLKLQVLPLLMNIDKMATIIGDFASFNLYLQTQKVAGNINACMGFVYDKKYNMYIPNTALKKDIRQITISTNKIVAIFKKDNEENLYKNLTYLKLNYEIKNVLSNGGINKIIDLSNIFSNEKLIKSKIIKYLYD